MLKQLKLKEKEKTNELRTQEELIQSEHVKNIVLHNSLEINDLPKTHSQKFLVARENDKFKSIEFQEQYRNKNIYIVSPLGSGKTELLNYWMSANFMNKNICFITF